MPPRDADRRGLDVRPSSKKSPLALRCSPLFVYDVQTESRTGGEHAPKPGQAHELAAEDMEQDKRQRGGNRQEEGADQRQHRIAVLRQHDRLYRQVGVALIYGSDEKHFGLPSVAQKDRAHTFRVQVLLRGMHLRYHISKPEALVLTPPPVAVQEERPHAGRAGSDIRRQRQGRGILETPLCITHRATLLHGHQLRARPNRSWCEARDRITRVARTPAVAVARPARQHPLLHCDHESRGSSCIRSANVFELP